MAFLPGTRIIYDNNTRWDRGPFGTARKAAGCAARRTRVRAPRAGRAVDAPATCQPASQARRGPPPARPLVRQCLCEKSRSHDVIARETRHALIAQVAREVALGAARTC